MFKRKNQFHSQFYMIYVNILIDESFFNFSLGKIQKLMKNLIFFWIIAREISTINQ